MNEFAYSMSVLTSNRFSCTNYILPFHMTSDIFSIYPYALSHSKRTFCSLGEIKSCFNMLLSCYFRWAEVVPGRGLGRALAPDLTGGIRAGAAVPALRTATECMSQTLALTVIAKRLREPLRSLGRCLKCGWLAVPLVLPLWFTDIRKMQKMP